MAKKTRPRAPEPPEPPPPPILETTPQYDRDLKRQEKRGKSKAAEDQAAEGQTYYSIASR